MSTGCGSVEIHLATSALATHKISRGSKIDSTATRAMAFVDVTTESGIVTKDGKGLGVVVTDFDDDGLVDIYVANDTTPNNMFKTWEAFVLKKWGWSLERL